MILRDISLSDPWDNISFDDVLLARAEENSGPEYLRLWESSRPFIVMGRISREDQDLLSGLVRQDGIPVLRRSSGGGTVVQGPGCLNYALVMDKNRSSDLADVNRSYRAILSHLVQSLSRFCPGIDFRPLSDLVMTQGPALERKFSGNAQLYS